MRTRKTMIGYKAVTEEYKGIHGTDFSIHSVHELPDTVPQAGKHGLTFALTLHHLFKCFNTEKLPIVVEVCAYGDTHIGRHLCATNHMVITRTLGYHEIQDILNREAQSVTVDDEDRPTSTLTAVSEEAEDDETYEVAVEENDSTDNELKAEPSKAIPESAQSKKSGKKGKNKAKDKTFVHRIPIHFLAMVIRYPRSFAEAVRVKHSMRKNGKAKS